MAGLSTSAIRDTTMVAATGRREQLDSATARARSPSRTARRPIHVDRPVAVHEGHGRACGGAHSAIASSRMETVAAPASLSTSQPKPIAA